MLGPSKEIPSGLEILLSTKSAEEQFLDLERLVSEHGVFKGDRTGTGTKSIFGYQMRFDLANGFPLLTTKETHFKSIAYELLWFLKGETNIAYLKEHGVKIWDQWADERGELGPVYGAQWRSWPDRDGGTIDQISRAIEEIKRNPDSRRLVVSAWNPADIPQMALPPCHILFQFYVAEGKLSCDMYQRSADIFLGLPFNMASYSLLTMMIAHVTDLKPGHMVISLGDAHLYTNHLDQAKLQLSRKPKSLPTINFKDPPKDLFAFDYHHFELKDYFPHPRIKAPIAV